MTTERITSKHNARVKNIRKLRARNERDQSGTFLVEGIRQVSQAIQSGAEVIELIVAPDLLRSQFALGLVEEQRRRGVTILELSGDVIASISERDHPQGLAAVARQVWHRLEDVVPARDSIWVALESVADPGNLGTILRTSDAVGASGVLLLGNSTDPFEPSAVRASMGAVFTQQLVRTSPDGLLRWVRQHEVMLVGTSPDAPLDYQAVDYSLPVMLLMGSERQGLPVSLQRACDRLIRLPMAGHVDSLNLAVATGVMLYEIFNQQRRRRFGAPGEAAGSRMPSRHVGRNVPARRPRRER